MIKLDLTAAGTSIRTNFIETIGINKKQIRWIPGTVLNWTTSFNDFQLFSQETQVASLDFTEVTINGNPFSSAQALADALAVLVESVVLEPRHQFSDTDLLTTPFTTGSTTFVEASTDTTPELRAGFYLLNVSFLWQMSVANRLGFMRLIVDSVPLPFDYEQKMSDPCNIQPMSYTSIKLDWTNDTEDHTIALEVHREVGGEAASISIHNFIYDVRFFES